jgi:hypothetical protein
MDPPNEETNPLGAPFDWSQEKTDDSFIVLRALCDSSVDCVSQCLNFESTLSRLPETNCDDD